METVDLESCLNRAFLFSGLEPREVEQLTRAITVKTYLPEEHLLTEGHDSYHGGMGVVLRGRLAVVQAPNRVLRRLGPGETFGEMSLIDDEPRSATVVAEERSEVGLLSRGDFRALITQHPEIALKLLSILAQRLREASSSLKSDLA